MYKVVSLGDRDGTARSFNTVQETYYNEHLGEKSRNENVVDLLVIGMLEVDKQVLGPRSQHFARSSDEPFNTLFKI